MDCSNADCPFRGRCQNKAGQIINKWSISVDTVGTIATTLDNLFGERYDVPCPFVTGDPPDMLAERRLRFDEDLIMMEATEGSFQNNAALCPNSNELKMQDDVIQFPHLAVFSCSVNSTNNISSAPIRFTWREQLFVLRGAILGGYNHFTAVMRDTNFWVFYDGMGGRNGYGKC